MIIAAWWGLGYAALIVAAVVLGGAIWRNERALGLIGQLLLVLGVLFVGAGLLTRSLKGHGWPFVSWSDAAAGIALLMLVFYLVWAAIAKASSVGFAAVVLALILLSFGLGQQVKAPVTLSFHPLEARLSALCIMCGGAFLALSAALGLSGLARSLLVDRFPAWRWVTQEMGIRAGEAFVRWALFFLAIGLAIDVWWVQKLDLGMTGSAQQAGIAIAWVIYFVAVRFYSHTHWRGWPWATFLVVAFICVLPILLDVSWLENTLLIERF
ncbi:MAG: hypothetical protein JXA89_06265 [Anaerolineae bacterium]|nr:hypothetical protein [Anaerolineae bacterium]